MNNFASKGTGQPLVATRTVDKNGRVTTVHKRSDTGSAASTALSAARPALGLQQQEERSHLIKPKKLPNDSPALRIGSAMGFLNDNVDEEEFREPSRRKPVKMADDVLYDFLRVGVDNQSAAAMTAFGISTVDDIPESAWDRMFPGSLGTMVNKSLVSHRQFGAVIERLQEAGVSAVDASKAITNGLQDAHLDQALTDEQLLQLFSKWTYKSACGNEDRRSNEQDNVINGFVSGMIPYELSNLNLNVLKSLEYELNGLERGQQLSKEDEVLKEKLKDRDYLIRLGRKFETMEGYNPLRTLDHLVEEHGDGVFELDYPQLAGVPNGDLDGERTTIGIEGAKYIEAAHRIAHESSENAYWMSTDRFSNFGGLEVDRSYLRNYELNDLREAGVSPEKAYDLLINHKLSPDQIIVAHETGINDALSTGAL